VVRKLVSEGEPLNTYDPRLFPLLGDFFNGLEVIYPEDHQNKGIWKSSLSHMLVQFLDSQQFEAALQEIRANSASYPAFQKRFWRWFNMFRIMKFLHFARERGFPDIPVGDAALQLLQRLNPAGVSPPSAPTDVKQLLNIYRKLDRS
jgi:hypothetical protein